MDIQSIQRMNYPVHTLLLCTPYVSKEDRDLNGLLTEHDFISDFYVESAYDALKVQLENELSLISNSKISEINALKRKISDIELKATEVNRFEKTILNTEDSESIGYIVACSGSGKTTYLHHLLFSHPEIKKIIFDLNRDSGDLLFCNRVVDLNSHIGIDYLKSTDTIYKFIRVILEKLNEIILLDNLKESMGWTKENKYIKYMRYLSLISKRFFCIFDKEDNISVLHRAYKDIFILFKDYDSDANRQVQVDKHCKFTEALFAKFIECAKIYCDERKSVKRDNCLISYIIQFIIILSVCCIPEDDYNNRDYKFVFAFDNIEYYINEEAVYDEDILQIEEVLCIIVSNMESFLGRAMEDKPIKEVFRSHFKFLMLVRDSTNFLNGVKNGILVGTRQDEDYMRSYIDITDMYTLSKIYQRRCQKLSEYGLLTTTDEGICEVMQDIISDSTIYDNSSAKMLDDMFNHNKRRITLYLLDVLSHPGVTQEFRRLKDLTTFFTYNNDNLAVSALKSASRSFILRHLFDNIEKNKYFEGLLTITRNSNNTNNNMGTGLARRILCFLWKHHIMNQYNTVMDSHEYVGFYSFVKGVLCSPTENAREIDKKIYQLANVIMKMNDPNRENTSWCQLVLIRFDRKSVDVETLAQELKESYKSKLNQTKKFGLKITSAGVFLLKSMCLFEYFACRYEQNSSALFDICYTNNPNSVNVVMNHITQIKRRTFQCIGYMKDFDDNFFSSPSGIINYTMLHNAFDYGDDLDKGKWNVHAVHIIAKQIGYLENFRCYIMKCYEYRKLSLLDESVRLLSIFILNTISEYISLYRELYNSVDSNGIPYIHHINNEDSILRLDQFVKEELNKLKSRNLRYTSIYRKVHRIA